MVQSAGARRVLAVGAIAAVLVGAWLARRHPSVQMLLLSRATLPELEQRVQTNPNDWRVQYWFGKRAMEAGDPERAEPALRAAYGTAPEFLPAATDLGKLLLAQGRVEESYQILRMVLGRDAGAGEARLALAKLYRSQEAYQRAIDELGILLAREPQNIAALYELGICQIGIQQPDEAEKTLRRALARDGKNVPALAALSRIHRERGDLPEAEALSRKALELASDDVLVRLELARVLRRKTPAGENIREAIKILDQALNLAPNETSIQLELGSLLAADGRYAQAATVLTGVVRRAPRTLNAYYLLADCYRRLGQAPEARRAEAEFKRLQGLGAELQVLYARLEQQPDSSDLRFRIAETHAATGDLEAAIRTYRTGVQRAPQNEKAKGRLAALIQRNLELQSRNATAP